MRSRPAKKDLAGTCGPKTFQRKVQIEKTAIESNYKLKPYFIEFFFRLRFFQCKPVAPKYFYIFLPIVQYMYLEVVLYPCLCKILTIIINMFIFVSIPVGASGKSQQLRVS